MIYSSLTITLLLQGCNVHAGMEIHKYLINFFNNGGQSFKEERKVEETFIHDVDRCHKELLTSLHHLTEHELKVFWLHEEFTWL